jgi:Zn ribbon nucleic-acid-binding protein
MNCHSQIWSDSPELEPVRASFRNNTSIEWTRVNTLPDYVYFDHSIHLAKGVGCVTCHGQVDAMPLMWRENTLTMEWCLECHRDPARYIRPREQVFAMHWQPPAAQRDFGQKLAATYKIVSTEKLTNCSTCHR